MEENSKGAVVFDSIFFILKKKNKKERKEKTTRESYGRSEVSAITSVGMIVETKTIPHANEKKNFQLIKRKEKKKSKKEIEKESERKNESVLDERENNGAHAAESGLISNH
ncbi:hypothetical protein PUN28_020266 [Cardiocondyla obscurior]|uniref:Uncharacterized protein n=1 Tax=Cardiocondyla obscurior TaxID=286306 RepID=A0AAW2EBB3_9HYME